MESEVRQRCLCRPRVALKSQVCTVHTWLTFSAGTNLQLRELSGISAGAEDRGTDMFDDYLRQKRRMEQWIIDEDSITINCRTYVVSIILGAAVIICGAMAIPFCVGSHIQGVDPFQLTSFAWILVAFMVVLAKSRYVSEWSWHDFLRGQIVCSSIRDVQDVR